MAGSFVSLGADRPGTGTVGARMRRDASKFLLSGNDQDNTLHGEIRASKRRVVARGMVVSGVGDVWCGG